MPKLSGNKGEWSEIYVFLRLLEVGKLYAADADLNKMDDVFYNIINIVRTENIGVLEFRVDRNAGRVSVYNTETAETVNVSTAFNLPTLPSTFTKARIRRRSVKRTILWRIT